MTTRGARTDGHVMSSTSEPSAYQRLREHLAYLEMSAAAEHLADELDRGMREKASPEPNCPMKTIMHRMVSPAKNTFWCLRNQ